MPAPRIGITSCPHADGPVEGVGREYVDAVLGAGGLPVVLPVLDPVHAADVLAGLDGLLLTGGADVDPAAYGGAAHPEVYGVDAARDAWELALAAAAQIPTLGVCRGAQVLNVAGGGTLVPHLPERTVTEHRDRDRGRELVHDVEVLGGSRLHAVVGGLQLGVNSLHHQAVDVVGDGLVVTAWAADGTAEAVEGTGDRPVLGVQWHPELLTDHEAHRSVFGWLVAAADAGRTHAELARPAMN